MSQIVIRKGEEKKDIRGEIKKRERERELKIGS